MTKNRKVLVTGATGYLGATIALYLKKQGYDVFGTCRNLSNIILEKFEGIELIQIDFTEVNLLDKLEKLEGINTIIHTVSLDHHQSQKFPLRDVNNTNILPTWELLSIFTKKNLSKFIYLSTLHVLGKLPNTDITEKTCVGPENIYALTHLMDEQIVNYYNKTTDTQCINVRLTNGYGAPIFDNNNCWWLVINDLCRMAFFEKKIVLQSDGKALRDFLHISDTAKSMEVLIENDIKNDNTINISSGITFSLLEVAHTIKEVFISKYKVDIPVFYQNNILSDIVPQINEKFFVKHDRLSELGYNPKMTLKMGIEELFNYFDSQK